MEGAGRISWTPLKVLAALATVGAMYFARQVLIPIAVALLVSLLLGPLVQLVERAKLPRVAAVVIVVAAMIALLCWLGFVATSQVSDLAEQMPQYKDRIRVKAVSIGEPLGGLLGKAYDALQELGRPENKPGPAALRVQVVPNPPTAWEVISLVMSAVVRTLGAFVLVTILVVFLLVYHADLRDRVVMLFGVHRINITTQTINESAESVSRYLLSQSAVNAVYGVLVGGVLLLLGVPNFFLWGFLAAVLRFVPYVGPWMGFAPPFLLMLAVFDGWSRPVAFLLIFACLELAIANVLEPLVYGKRVGLSPLALIVAAVFWTWLWGNAGLLLAVPLTVCLEVLGRHVPSLGFLSTFLARDTTVEPHVRFYQRLLGMNAADAAEVVESFRRRKSIAEVYDEILIPALVMAERDAHLGELDPGTHEALLRDVEQILEDLEEEAVPVTEPRIRFACVPAGGRADELACRMFAHALADRKIRVDVVPAAGMTAAKVEQLDRLQADAACISTLVTSGRFHARHLYKRLRRHHADLPVLAGVWGSAEGARMFTERLSEDPRVHAAGSLAEAGERIEQLIPEIRIRNNASTAS
jgi:predicted PurR-regulated permease PerM